MFQLKIAFNWLTMKSKSLKRKNEVAKAKFLDGIRLAFEELKLIGAGKLNGKPIQKLLDEFDHKG
jgi:uncharacterized coiled-coil DUF342 family protein